MIEYTNEILDRVTGELTTVSLGHWVTISELADLYGVGRRQVRTILRAMNFLQLEGVGRHQRHRLARWVTEQGLGKRIERKHTVPFDVIGPEARAWIAERWADTVADLEAAKSSPVLAAQAALEMFKADRDRRDMPVEEMVSWLADHNPTLTQMEIASIVSVTQQVVGRYLAKRSKQRRELQALRSWMPERKPKQILGTQFDRL